MAVEVGMVVWLKSGGPAMTVKELNEHNGFWICSWFVGNELKQDYFNRDQLTDKDPKPSGVKITAVGRKS